MADEDEAQTTRYQQAGGWLREARIAAEMTVHQVAAALKMSPRQVEALERDDYAALPGGMFLRGFVRNYAKLLKLEPESLVSLLDPNAERSDDRRLVNTDFKEVPFQQGSPAWTRYVAPLAGLAVVVAVAAYWIDRIWDPLQLDLPAFSLLSSTREPAAVPVAARVTVLSVLPGVLLPVEMPPTASSLLSVAPPVPDTQSSRAVELALRQEFGSQDGAATLEFVFDAESWVEIHDKSGRRLVSQLMTPGSQPRVRGTPPFKLVVGNARKVRLTYQGKPVDLVSGLQAGDVARITLD